MALIAWPDGFVKGPDGPCRQMPQRHTWMSVVMICKDGTARRRYYDPIQRQWRFDEQPMNLAYDATQERLGYFHDGCWVSLERAVLLAWAYRHPLSPGSIGEDGIELVDAKKTSRRLPFAWKIGEAPEKQEAIPGETWKPLRWSIGLYPVPAGYQISSEGRLRNPHGKTTRGLYYKGDRWAAVHGGVLVNLTVAAGLRRNDVDLTPALWTAAEALGTGETPEMLAHAQVVQTSTAWNRFVRVAPFFPKGDLKQRVSQLVARDLWRLLEKMVKNREAIVSGALTELMSEALRRLGRGGEFRRSEYQWEQLRLARLTCLKG